MREKILVVDDEEQVRGLLSAALSEDGYEVVTAEDGSRALAVARGEPLDLAITDLRMPGMDGMELSRELIFLCPELPILICTAYPELETAREAVRIGAREYLLKPIDLEELRRCVRRSLELRQLRRELKDKYERLVHLERTRQTLTSWIVDDLKRPLTEVRASLAVLLNGAAGPLSADQREILAHLSGGVARATLLTDQLETLTLLERDQLFLRTEEVEIGSLLRDLIEASGRIAVQSPPSLPPLRGDRGLIATALMGLIGCSGGSVRLEARGDGPVVEIRVVHEEWSIAEELRTGTVEPVEGPDAANLAIGLARKIAAAHGGVLEIGGGSTEGTSFLFRLPAAGRE